MSEVETPRARLALALLFAVAAALRLHGLGSQLWIDEVDAVLASIRRPALEIATAWPRATSHVLYDLCARASLVLLGEGPFALRLPAALFGVAGVAALHRLARDILGGRRALLAGGLLAVSYHHVFQSQNARGYTALIFFFLAASLLLVRLGERGRVGAGGGIAYAAASALAAYSILLGAFVAAGHVAAVLLAAAAAWLRRRPAPLPPAAFLPWAALGILLGALLYSPFLGELYGFAHWQAALPSGSATGVLYRLSVVREAMAGLSQGLLGPIGLGAAALCAGVGLIDWWRRRPFSLAVLATPVLLELVALPASGIPLNPRYFAIALPIAVLAGGNGLAALVDAGLGLVPAAQAVRRRLEALLLAAAVMASALPLAHYYRVPKQDFEGAIARVRSLAAPGDQRVALHYAGHVLGNYYHAGFQPVRTLADLEAQEHSGRRIWLVTTLERHLAAQEPALYGHVAERYRLVEVLPATVRDAEMRLYRSATP